MSTGPSAVLDSDVIILGSKKLVDVDKLVSRYDRLYVSIISYKEVYALTFSNYGERDLNDEIFTNLEIVDAGKNIADHAIRYRSNKAKKIKLPDSVIIATAKHLQATLITNSLSDFQGIDSSVVIAGIDDLMIRYKPNLHSHLYENIGDSSFPLFNPRRILPAKTDVYDLEDRRSQKDRRSKGRCIGRSEGC